MGLLVWISDILYTNYNTGGNTADIIFSVTSFVLEMAVEHLIWLTHFSPVMNGSGGDLGDEQIY